MKKKGQGNLCFTPIPPQVRIIEDIQGGGENRPITPTEVIVITDGDNTHHHQNYSRQSPQDQVS